MSLEQWFKKNAQAPLILAALLIFLLWGGGALDSSLRAHAKHKSSLVQLSELASLALEQRNRALMEALLYTAQVQMDVSAIALCEGKTQIITSAPGRNLCEGARGGVFLSESQIDESLIGQVNHRVVASYSKFALGGNLLWLYWPMSLIFLAGALWSMRRTIFNFERDILRPLKRGAFYGHQPIAINELEEIRKNYRQFSEAQTQLAISEALSRQSRQVAHDIRSPLSALKILVAKMSDASFQSKQALLHSVTQRISDIADQLDHPRERECQRPADKDKKVFLNDLVRDIVLEKRVGLKEDKKIDLEMSMEGAEELICCLDPVELGRAISNLIDNSIEAIDDQGAVSLHLSTEARGVTIQISDTGRGIPQAVLPQVGQYKFSYGKQIRQGKSGSGLGVHQAKSFVEGLGGSFQIESQVGRGTGVQLLIPFKWFDGDHSKIFPSHYALYGKFMRN